MPTLNLFNQNYITNVSLYGLKDLQQSSVTELTLYQPLKDKPEYDNWPPQIKNTGDYDLILPNGSSKTSVAISSDAPVFAYVLNSSYSAATSWTKEEWESKEYYYVDKSSGKFLSLGPDNNIPKNSTFQKMSPIQETVIV